MTTVTVERILDVPAREAWAVLADFGGLLDWAGSGKTELEGEGIGMIRHLEMDGMGKIGEKLEVLDHDEMVLGYALTYGEVGMKRYEARIRVHPQGSQACKVLWQGDYEAADGVDLAAGITALETAYNGMSDALEAHVKTQHAKE